MLRAEGLNWWAHGHSPCTNSLTAALLTGKSNLEQVELKRGKSGTYYSVFLSHRHVGFSLAAQDQIGARPDRSNRLKWHGKTSCDVGLD